MPVSLAISDNADGSGGVATISGSLGASNAVYCAAYSNGMGPATWTLAGSRVGDGAVGVAPGSGYYFWYCLTTGSAQPSNLVNQNLTTGTQSVHYRCLLAVQSQVQALALAGIASNVVLQWMRPEDKPPIVSTPVIGICPVGREGQPGILTGKDDIDYPVLVGINDLGLFDTTLNIALRTLWRQSIFRCFRNQPLPGVPEIITTLTDPEPIVDSAWFRKTMFVSALVFKFRSREVRGFGT